MGKAHEIALCLYYIPENTFADKISGEKTQEPENYVALMLAT